MGSLGTNAFRHIHSSNIPSGKDEGVKTLAVSDSFAAFGVADYIWIDGDGMTRCKSKTITHKPTSADDCGIWMYDGSSTNQATGGESDVYLVPRAIFDDPFRGSPNVMVMCEAVTALMEPAVGNYRAMCAEIMDKNAAHDPWFGVEQEYTLMVKDKMGEHSQVPYGFNKDGSEPAAQGPYYCGAGNQNMAKGLRKLMDDHYACCLAAGIKITGTNGEVMPGQGEFQIGPCRGVEIGDHMMMARHLLQMLTEEHEFSVTIHPKPMAGDWNGAGCHTNFSTKETRAEGGLQVIEKICRAFGRKAKEHIAAYGEDNDKRLTGRHETGDINSFSFAVASRGGSIRIPRNVGMTGRGYMEDRRPASNCDPYRVCAVMMKTASEALQK